MYLIVFFYIAAPKLCAHDVLPLDIAAADNGKIFVETTSGDLKLVENYSVLRGSNEDYKIPANINEAKIIIMTEPLQLVDYSFAIQGIKALKVKLYTFNQVYTVELDEVRCSIFHVKSLNIYQFC